MTGEKWNQTEIEKHLTSAVHTLTPDVLNKIDLNTPQNVYSASSGSVRRYRRLRSIAAAAAACLCAAVIGSGANRYADSRVDSIIGLDVNPSIEISVNRKEKVLKANPLNTDAEQILDDMDLKGVSLDIAVNALVGSMVRNGYLTELENAILVSVSNENEEKASLLRQDVVLDLEESLEAHQVQAVVYDQQTPEKDEVRKLSAQYDISYGKAYFLKELVEENDLSEANLSAFADMTMEEIAREIAERSYSLRTEEGVTENQVTEPEQKKETFETETELSETGENPQTEKEDETAQAEIPETIGSETEAAEITAAETKSDVKKGSETDISADGEDIGEEAERKVRIDDVDYEDGILDVVFEQKVKWKNPAVSVQDDSGQRYSAMILDTSSDSCTIQVRGLTGGAEYSFTLAGVAVKDSKSYGSVKGYFEVPEIAEEAEPNVSDSNRSDSDRSEPEIPDSEREEYRTEEKDDTEGPEESEDPELDLEEMAN